MDTTKIKTGNNLTATGYHRAGAICGCVHLHAHDIGRAKVAGKSIWFAWGANISAEDAEKWRTNNGFDTVKCGDFFSLVIPAAVMTRLSGAIVWGNGRDKAVLARQIKKATTPHRAGSRRNNNNNNAPGTSTGQNQNRIDIMKTQLRTITNGNGKTMSLRIAPSDTIQHIWHTVYWHVTPGQKKRIDAASDDTAWKTEKGAMIIFHSKN